jgi:uncharacterized membrane protein YozB (DUF420 family)
MDKVLESIRSFFAAVEKMRLPPSSVVFPDNTSVISLSKLVVAAALLFIARSTAAGSGDLTSQTTLLTGVAIVLFFLVGLFIRLTLRGNRAEKASNQVTTFVFLYWLLCLVIIGITDLPLLIFSQRPLGTLIFDELPLGFGLDVPVLAVDICRSMLCALVGWIFLFLKTKNGWRGFRLSEAFLTSEFPVYFSIVSALVFFLVIRIY